MYVKRLIYGAPLAVLMFIYMRGEEGRLVHYLEAHGYSDIQIEHPDQWHCVHGWHPNSYRARSPNGHSVHGGACVVFFMFDTIEPIGKK